MTVSIRITADSPEEASAAQEAIASVLTVALRGEKRRRTFGVNRYLEARFPKQQAGQREAHSQGFP